MYESQGVERVRRKEYVYNIANEKYHCKVDVRSKFSESRGKKVQRDKKHKHV